MKPRKVKPVMAWAYVGDRETRLHVARVSDSPHGTYARSVGNGWTTIRGRWIRIRIVPVPPRRAKK